MAEKGLNTSAARTFCAISGFHLENNFVQRMKKTTVLLPVDRMTLQNFVVHAIRVKYCMNVYLIILLPHSTYPVCMYLEHTIHCALV